MDAQAQTDLLSGEVDLLDFVKCHMENLGLHYEADSSNSAQGHDNLRGDLSGIIVVLNKMDLLNSSHVSEFLSKNGDHVCTISCLTGQGFDSFMEKLVHKIKDL